MCCCQQRGIPSITEPSSSKLALTRPNKPQARLNDRLTEVHRHAPPPVTTLSCVMTRLPITRHNNTHARLTSHLWQSDAAGSPHPTRLKLYWQQFAVWKHFLDRFDVHIFLHSWQFHTHTTHTHVRNPAQKNWTTEYPTLALRPFRNFTAVHILGARHRACLVNLEQAHACYGILEKAICQRLQLTHARHSPGNRRCASHLGSSSPLEATWKATSNVERPHFSIFVR